MNPSSGPNVPFRGSYHRRAHSDVHFPIPNDIDLVSDSIDGQSPPFADEDDLYTAFMDIETLGSKLDDHSPKSDTPGGAGEFETEEGEQSLRPRRRYSHSVDGFSILDTIEAKKAMAPEKLAELWAIDPKRAKRGFRLPASHVIHTVGPIYSTDKNPPASLRNAYRNSLDVAKKNGIQYVGFTAISCGVYGYPYDEAATIAISAVREFASELKEVHFVLFSSDIYNVWLNKAAELLN